MMVLAGWAEFGLINPPQLWNQSWRGGRGEGRGEALKKGLINSEM